MIASLPMYDAPENRPANDRLWAGVRDRLRADGIAAPETLHREGDLWDHWRAPDLVLSQTCGLPLRSRLHRQVTLVATPDHGLEGCEPGQYRSVLIARTDDPRDSLADFAAAPLAINDALSQSGWAAVWDMADRAGLRLCPQAPTGAHRLSALAVAEGRADWAAVDAVTWQMLTRAEGWTQRLRVFGHSRPTPALPFIAGPGADAPRLRAALGAAIAALSPDDRATLCLRGVVEIPLADYLGVPLPAAP